MALATAMLEADSVTSRRGVTVALTAAGRVVARLLITDDMTDGHGLCHGGSVFLLADTALDYACNSHGLPAVAAGADICFLSPAPARRVTAADRSACSPSTAATTSRRTMTRHL